MDTPLFPSLPVLIVDDEESALFTMKVVLRVGGITRVITCKDSREVMGLLSEQEMSVVMLDLTMPHLPGEVLLPQIVQQY